VTIFGIRFTEKALKSHEKQKKNQLRVSARYPAKKQNGSGGARFAADDDGFEEFGGCKNILLDDQSAGDLRT